MVKIHLFSYLAEIDLNNSADIANSFDLLEKLLIEPPDTFQHASQLYQMDAEGLDDVQKNFRTILNVSRNFNYGRHAPDNRWLHLTHWNLGDNWLIWCLASFYENGYIREQALKNLIALQENIVLPFLFLRMIDWVEPIRKLAALELLKRLDSSNSVGPCCTIALIA